FSTNKLNPANYYEQQLPTVEKYIDDVGESILFSNNQGQLETVIPIEGIDYQVMDSDGQIVYGTYQTKLVGNGEQLKQNIATGVTRQYGGFIKYYPINNEQGILQGAVVFKYGLSVFSSNPHNKWLILLLGMVLLLVIAPFKFFY